MYYITYCMTNYITHIHKRLQFDLWGQLGWWDKHLEGFKGPVHRFLQQMVIANSQPPSSRWSPPSQLTRCHTNTHVTTPSDSRQEPRLERKAVNSGLSQTSMKHRTFRIFSSTGVTWPFNRRWPELRSAVATILGHWLKGHVTRRQVFLTTNHRAC